MPTKKLTTKGSGGDSSSGGRDIKMPSSISMNALSTSNQQQKQQQQHNSTIIKIVLLCKNCSMVFIGEKRRVLCPFCGTFFDSKLEQESGSGCANLNHHKRRQISGSLSNKLDTVHHSSSSSSSSEVNSPGSSSGDDSDSNASKSGGGGSKLKEFFKSLIRRKPLKSTKNSSNSRSNQYQKKKNSTETNLENNLEKIKNSMPKPDANGLIEITDLKHPFLTVRNQDPNFFSDYRENHLYKELNEFRTHFKMAAETKNFDSVREFYCWIFSSTNHLTDLLIMKKRRESTPSLQRNESQPSGNDKSKEPNYGLSTNWKFMREIGNCCLKVDKQSIN
jgi:hypothetical protein